MAQKHIGNGDTRWYLPTQGIRERWVWENDFFFFCFGFFYHKKKYL